MFHQSFSKKLAVPHVRQPITSRFIICFQNNFYLQNNFFEFNLNFFWGREERSRVHETIDVILRKRDRRQFQTKVIRVFALPVNHSINQTG